MKPTTYDYAKYPEDAERHILGPRFDVAHSLDPAGARALLARLNACDHELEEALTPATEWQDPSRPPAKTPIVDRLQAFERATDLEKTVKRAVVDLIAAAAAMLARHAADLTAAAIPWDRAQIHAVQGMPTEVISTLRTMPPHLLELIPQRLPRARILFDLLLFTPGPQALAATYLMGGPSAIASLAAIRALDFAATLPADLAPKLAAGLMRIAGMRSDDPPDTDAPYDWIWDLVEAPTAEDLTLPTHRPMAELRATGSRHLYCELLRAHTRATGKW